MDNSSTDTPYFIEPAKLNWREGDLPVSTDFDDIYFSTEHGLQETEYVFLQHNALAERWQQLPRDSQGIFTIVETGFGTGLNFLATWRLWLKFAPKNWQLHYISAEKHPLIHSDLTKALTAWPELTELSGELINNYPPLIAGQHSLLFSDQKIQLKLLFGDAVEQLTLLLGNNSLTAAKPSHFKVDAWFLDGFAPAKNPQLWSDGLFQLMNTLSREDSTVATFTAVGAVRRGLTSQGFAMRKVKGFGNKREMLCGHFTGETSNTEECDSLTNSKPIKPTPWFQLPSSPVNNCEHNKTVAVIGGGLAGTTTANALACRGWQVTLIDSADELASGASGNSQGMLYTKLSHESGVLSQFALTSYLFALRFFKQLQQQQKLTPDQIDLCGLLQLAFSEKEQKLLQKVKDRFSHQQDWVRFIEEKEASHIAGVDCPFPASFFSSRRLGKPQRFMRTIGTTSKHRCTTQ